MKECCMDENSSAPETSETHLHPEAPALDPANETNTSEPPPRDPPGELNESQVDLAAEQDEDPDSGQVSDAPDEPVNGE